MGVSNNRKEEILNFLDMLRTDMGFMIYQKGEERMVSNERWTAKDFVQVIFEIENLDPEYELKLFREVKNKFTDRFGNYI